MHLFSVPFAPYSLVLCSRFRHYALSAAAALLKYIEFIQNVMYARKTLKVTYTAIDDCCLIGTY